MTLPDNLKEFWKKPALSALMALSALIYYARTMFAKRGTIDPRYSDQAQAIAVNKQLTLPV